MKIIATIGHTPLVRPNIGNGRILAKGGVAQPELQRQVPYRRQYDLGMPKAWRVPKTAPRESTSGNTGIALAHVAAARGYKLTLTMPETMSIERRVTKSIRRESGADRRGERMKGAIQKAVKKLSPAIRKNTLLQQFQQPCQPGNSFVFHRPGNLGRHRWSGWMCLSPASVLAVR